MRTFNRLVFGGLISSLACAVNAEEPSTRKQPVVFTTQQDWQNMLDQLGLAKMRRGRDADTKSQNAANYDESKANPYPDLPELLLTENGEAVATPQQWWETRRPEIAELLQREIYGRVPENVPEVTWEVSETREIEAGGKKAIQRHVVGVVDNSACPEIEVNISMSVTLPKDAPEPVPMLMSFGRTPFEPSPVNAGNRGDGPRLPSKQDKLIAAGWGAVVLNPTTVQADTGGWQPRRFDPNADPNAKPEGAGLTRGIIGLVNCGQPRKPDDWGALRAWAWGASRGLDYLETLPEVDEKKVGIAGVSRYGKAALVTLGFDQRFAMGLIASSGAGGTALYRREFGESLENLASSGAYHWMAGNFLKYAADEGKFGCMTPDDLPVDSHMAIALCAPRLTFISHGIPERGDALWLDHQGSFMAAIAAQPVFRLLGAEGLDRSDDYKSEKMPDVNVALLDGQLAWRQHDGGHTDEPNVEHFIVWADKHFGRATNGDTDPVPATVSSGAEQPQALERTDANSRTAHQQLLEKAKAGQIDVYFVGDSITRRWGATDYPQLLKNWNKHFHGWDAANFGWGGDSTQNILWRLQNGEFDDLSPQIVVLQAGTNNLPWNGPADDAKVDEIVGGLKAIIQLVRDRSPDTTVVLTGLFPRPQNPTLSKTIAQINERLRRLVDGDRIRYIEINRLLADEEGNFRPNVSSDGLHLEEAGYEIWASALKPIFHEVIGPPAETDQAPPPTGDPSARR